MSGRWGIYHALNSPRCHLRDSHQGGLKKKKRKEKKKKKERKKKNCDKFCFLNYCFDPSDY